MHCLSGCVIGLTVWSIATRAQPPAGGHADSATFTVGTATAQRGTLATGVLAVPPGSDSALDVPVAVIHGARPGPVVALVAGSHGTEYSTIIAMQHLIPRIDPARLAGTVIIVPVLNVPSFEQMMPRVNPVDGKPMVYPFPGDSSGTQSERAISLFTREVIARADVVVDFHDGDFDENMRPPFSAVVLGGRAHQDSAGVRLAMAFGLDHIVVYMRNAESPTAGRSLSGQALVRGKTVFLAAVGRSGIVAPSDLTAVITGSLDLLGALRMLDRPPPPTIRPVWLDGSAPRIEADRGGVFIASVAPNAHVSRCQTLGYTTDLLGRKTGEIRSPVDGLVMYIHGVPSMAPGTTLAEVFPILPALPAWKAPTAGSPPLSGCSQGAGPHVESQTSGTSARLSAISIVNPNTVWVSGAHGTYVRTTDGGKTWQASVMPGGDSLTFTGVQAFSADRALLFSAGQGLRARVYRTTDGGRNWTVVFQNRDSSAFYDCMTFRGDNGVVLGDALNGTFPIQRTTDGGATWKSYSPPGYRQVHAIDGEGAAAFGRCVVIGADSSIVFGTTKGGRVVRVGSTSSSVTETPIVHGGATSGVLTVAFRDSGSGVAAGGDLAKGDTVTHNVIRTRDGGRTWTLGGNTPMPAVFALAYLQAPRRVVVAVSAKGSAWSSDDGMTWHQFDDRDHWSVAFGPSGIGWMVGPDGRVTKITFD